MKVWRERIEGRVFSPGRVCLMGVLLIVCTWSVMAAPDDNPGEVSVRIYYEVGKSFVCPEYMDNANSLELLARECRLLVEQQKEGLTVALYLKSFASPEGSGQFNFSIRKDRSESILALLNEKTGIAGLVQVAEENTYCDWATMEELLMKSAIEYKEEALQIVRNVPVYTYDEEGKLIGSRKRDLMRLRGGKVWNDMLRDIYPYLRFSEVRIVLATPEEVEALKRGCSCSDPECHCTWDGQSCTCELSEKQVVAQRDFTPVEISVPEEVGTKKNPYGISLRTNMLYDLVLVPNVGIELSIGERWSLLGSLASAWWANDAAHRYWRVQGGELEGRYYLTKQRAGRALRGHHVGLYGQVFSYDFELGGPGILSKFSYGAGMSYGYQLPLSRRFSLDFVMGVGYVGGRFLKYTTPSCGRDCYPWKEKVERRYFGPSMAAISLVWSLGDLNDK